MISTNLKKNVKKLCRWGNNTNHEEDCIGIHVSRIQCLPLSSLSGSIPGDVSWCPSLVLGNLFETTNNPVCFRFGWSLLFCPASFSSALGSGVVHLMTWEDYQYLLHLPPEGASAAIGRVGTLSTLGDTVPFSWKMVGMFPHPFTTHLGLSQILFNNVWFLVN